MQVKKISKNAIASIIVQLVNVIFNIVLPPMLIATYGSQINGLVSTIKQIMSYVSLVGAGISVSVMQAFYKPLATGDKEMVSGMFNAASKSFFKVGIIFSFCSIVLAFVYPFIIKGNLQYVTVMLLVLVISIQGASEFFITGKCRALLFADKRSYISSIIQGISLGISFVIAYTMIKLKLNIVWVQIAYSLMYFLRIFALYWYVKKHYKYLNKKTPPVALAVANRKYAMVHQLTGLLVNGSQTIVLSTFVGLEAASIFSVYWLIISGLGVVCTQLMNAVTPFVGQSMAVSDSERTKKDYNLIEFSFSLVHSYVVAMCAVFILPFISIYVKGKPDVAYADLYLAVLFVIYCFIYNMRAPGVMLHSAAGVFKETISRAVIEASVCVVLQVVLVQFLGIYGVLIGSIVALLGRSIDVVLYSNHRILKQKSKRTFGRIIKSVIVLGCDLLVAKFLLPFHLGNYVDFLVWALIYSAITFGFIMIVNFICEYKLVLRVIQIVIRKLCDILIRKKNKKQI